MALCALACALMMMRRGLKKRLCDAAQDLSDYVLNSLMYDARDAASSITARLDVSWRQACMGACPAWAAAANFVC